VHGEAADTVHATELPDEPKPRHTFLSEKYSEPVYELADSGEPAQIEEQHAEKKEEKEQKDGLGEAFDKIEEEGNAAELETDTGVKPTVEEPLEDHVDGGSASGAKKL
jgi:hypothetical protein